MLTLWISKSLWWPASKASTSSWLSSDDAIDAIDLGFSTECFWLFTGRVPEDEVNLVWDSRSPGAFSADIVECFGVSVRYDVIVVVEMCI